MPPTALFKEAGGLLLEKLDLHSAALSIASTAETTTDGFLAKLKLDATIASGTAAKVVLPVPGGATTVDRAALTIAFGQGVRREMERVARRRPALDRYLRVEAAWR